MKYGIFWTTLLAGSLAAVIRWYHPAVFSVNAISFLWLISFTAAFLIITEKKKTPKTPVRPNRILHITLFYPPAGNEIARQVAGIVAQTRNMNKDQDIRILAGPFKSDNFSLISPQELLDDPIYVQRLHYIKWPFLKTPYLQALSYYISHHKPDFIYVHGDMSGQLTSAAKRYAARTNIPVVVSPD